MITGVNGLRKYGEWVLLGQPDCRSGREHKWEKDKRTKRSARHGYLLNESGANLIGSRAYLSRLVVSRTAQR
jgi:hypothetical protein